MDEQHRADLERILANRRAAGRLKAVPASQSPTRADVRDQSSSRVGFLQDQPSSRLGGFQDPQSSSGVAPARADSEPRFQGNGDAPRSDSDVAALRRQLTDLQARLVASQSEQSGKLGDLQEGLRAVQETLVAAADSQRQRSLARTKGMMQPVPRLVPDVSAPSEFRKSGRNNSRTDPTVVDFATRFGVGAPAPAEPPLAARPLSAEAIDVNTSVKMLRTGDWWLKWNSAGTDVEPRYVWLNTDTYVMQWGKAPSSSNVLSNFLRIEEIADVQTSQLVEHHETGSRVFYILVISSFARTIRLGTEKREKINRWFEAVSNIITFYRTFSRGDRRLASSSD